MTTTDFSETDLFRDRELPHDPYPFYDWVREQGPIWYYPLWNVYLVTGYEEVISIYHDQATWSNCNTTAGRGESVIAGEHNGVRSRILLFRPDVAPRVLLSAIDVVEIFAAGGSDYVLVGPKTVTRWRYRPRR